MSTCTLGLSEAMASSGVHKRKSSDKQSSSVEGGSSQGEPSVLRGMMPCVVGIAGVSLLLWALFYFYVPPETFSGKTMCTRVSDPVSLAGDLRGVTDWEGLARELGVPLDEIQGENRIEQILKVWTKRSGRPCWEKLVKTMKRLNELELAENFSKKIEA